MTWRDEYRTASFRGIPFRVGAAGQDVGRRLQLHEYPLRDVPYAEDLGRRARRFTLEGWIVGPDYNASRDRLLEACEQDGPGELVHPYRGTLRVSCESLTTRESSEEGGLVRLVFTFVESGEAASPVVSPDTAGLAGAAASATTAAASSDFAGRLEVDGVPGFVLDAITDTLSDVSAWIARQQLDGPPGSVSRLLSSSGGLADRVIDLAYDPAGTAGEIVDTVQSIKDGFSSRLAALAALDRAFELEPAAFEGVSPLQSSAQGNALAVVELVQTAAVSEQVELAAAIPWASLDEAVAARDAIADRIDALAGTAPDPTLVQLSGLRRALGAAVPPPDQSLPRLATFTPRRTTPSLVLAWGLYGARSRAAELEARNRPRRPGFVPGGSPLEVLNA